MKKITIIVLGIILSFSFAEQASAQYNKAKWLDGTWIGYGFQPDAASGASWTIILTIDTKNKTAKVEYPSLNCAADFILEKANKYQATFKEKLTSGKTRCLDDEIVIITKINNDFITISFFHPSYSTHVLSFSTLEKKK